jgi:tetratricopeptide (TPR) repeat protein
MNQIILYILIWVLDNTSYQKVSARNKAEVEGESAFYQKNYQLAAKQYKKVSVNSFAPKPEVLLNTAHSFFEAKDTLNARKIYTKLTKINNPDIASVSNQQLGYLACQKGDSARAIEYFKMAVLLKPDNEQARFDYELAKKLYHPKENNNKKNPPKKDEEPKDKKDKEQQGDKSKSEQSKKETQKNDSQQQMLKTLKDYGLTPEKAKMILEAMKNNDTQYIQQRQNAMHKKETSISQSW